MSVACDRLIAYYYWQVPIAPELAILKRTVAKKSWVVPNPSRAFTGAKSEKRVLETDYIFVRCQYTLPNCMILVSIKKLNP